MWLLLDIGNSAVKAGVFDPMASETGELLASHRIELEADPRSQLEELISNTPISRVGGVSVVPSQTPSWGDVCQEVCGCTALFFNASSMLPFELRYETPATLGNDRIAVAAGGWTRFGAKGRQGVIVVDAGTAINYEVVTAGGEYLGGVIAAGPGLMRQALGSGTAQLPIIDLPNVDLVIPLSRIGRSTDTALRSGIIFGMQDAVQTMVKGIQEELGGSFEVVLTGGWGSWLSKQTGYRCEPELVLKGVADLMRLSAR